MLNKILKWLNILITIFPIVILPIPIWVIVILSIILFAVSFLKPGFEPIPSIIEGVAWGFGLFALFAGPFDWLFIVGIILFLVWLVTTIVYLVEWHKIKNSYKF